MKLSGLPPMDGVNKHIGPPKNFRTPSRRTNINSPDASTSSIEREGEYLQAEMRRVEKEYLLRTLQLYSQTIDFTSFRIRPNSYVVFQQFVEGQKPSEKLAIVAYTLGVNPKDFVIMPDGGLYPLSIDYYNDQSTSTTNSTITQVKTSLGYVSGTSLTTDSNQAVSIANRDLKVLRWDVRNINDFFNQGKVAPSLEIKRNSDPDADIRCCVVKFAQDNSLNALKNNGNIVNTAFETLNSSNILVNGSRADTIIQSRNLKNID